MTITSSECTAVMTTYNGARFLAEQLASLEQQAASPKEISAAFAKKAAFDVTLVDGPHQGYAENFWSAARLADKAGGLG